LNIAFDWLQHWGFLPQPSGSTYESTASRPLGTKIPSTAISQSMFSVQQWKQQWHDFTLAIRARLNLTRAKTKAQVAENRRTIAASTAPPESSSNFTAAMEPTMAARKNKIKLVVQMLGSFSITIEDQPIKLPASRGLSLLKYLLLHHKQDTLREVLMEIFWPDSDPEASRNNLNVAMHSLRQALRSFTDLAVIRFENGAYGLDTNLELWLDVEEFERCVKEGQRLESQNQLDSALTEFEIAVNLYRGDFLADTPYESWTVLDRERLRIAYLDILEHLSEIFFSQERYAASATLCQLILSRDLCREDAHCRLMQCYSRLGQVPLALRQYQICVEALRTELEVDPAPETRQLYERIRHHEHV
jgi:DNA-binding SARP family transcriptional activator